MRTGIRAAVWAITFLLLSTSAYAVNYYVDSNKGDDSKTGTSEKMAWKSIKKINSRTFQPGDNIYLLAGSVWREQLNINSAGTTSSPITFSSYGNGELPTISGADELEGFEQQSSTIWKKRTDIPRAVFFDDNRGVKKNSRSELKNEKDWFYSEGYLYMMAFNPATAYTIIEASVRSNAISISGRNIVVRGIRVQRTLNDAIHVSAKAENIIIDNIEALQWTDEINSARGGVAIFGRNCAVKNSVFGKKTGNDIADQNWAGFVAIVVSGYGTECSNNKIYHNSVENEISDAKYAYGIRINSVSGKIKVHDNIIYHTASNGILADGTTKSGDEIRIYGNQVSYTGQAGIAAYKTRGSDGIGGKGYIYDNEVSYANRLGGEKGSGGNRAAGVHFNDGIQSETDPASPFIKWYCYENNVRNSQSMRERNSPDSDGIAIDFNANGTEIYPNVIYNCDGKGIYIWNADNVKVSYNIVYGNDCGITVSGSGKKNETANNNEVFNNVFYKNYNGDNRGPNYDTEIYFGLNGNNNRFVNNILYASKNGVAYLFNDKNTSGCFTDYNLVYSESGAAGYIGKDDRGKKFSEWKSDHPKWDRNSVNADPLFKNAAEFDFRLKTNSPAVNRGTPIGNVGDFVGLPVIGQPDIGAYESSNQLN